MKVSDYVIKFLESKNVKHVFAISGGGCMHLIDSLGASKNISYTCNHHEQASAMAAEGYSRMSGEIGVCIVTTGPGGTNTITGVMGAWTDSIPVMFISGQVQTKHLSDGTGCRQVGDQEINIIKLVKSITKYSKRVDNKNDIAACLNEAYTQATTGRPGPVWIDIPLDVQSKTIQDIDNLKTYSQYKPPRPEKTTMSLLINKLQESKKPLFVLGGGVRLSSGAIEAMNLLLLKHNIPVVTGAHSAVDVVNQSYAHYCGRIGIL